MIPEPRFTASAAPRVGVPNHGPGAYFLFYLLVFPCLTLAYYDPYLEEEVVVEPSVVCDRPYHIEMFHVEHGWVIRQVYDSEALRCRVE